MRQNSKNNNRSRGRGRKGPNPLTRSYESNGPDVKVRGTAQHVAEKYLTLARDALSSGDTVGAESYFQHAEHYNRIIMTAQTQQNAAREEERRQQQSHENTVQPSVNVEQPNAQTEQPSVNAESRNAAPTGEEAQPAIAVNENETVPETKSKATADKEDAPKPRRRRAPARSRRSAESKDDVKQKDTVEAPAVETATDTIASNPPAFLMND